MLSARRTRPVLLVLAIALLAAVAACSSGGSSPTPAASSVSPSAAGSASSSAAPVDTSKLVVYSGRSKALVEPLFANFTKATGIAVSPRYAGSAELAQQLMEEGDKSEVDVFFSQDAGALGVLSKQGRLQAIPPASLDRVDARFRGGAGDWVGVSGRSRVLVYDPRKVSAAELPKTIDDVTGPRWKGKVGFAPTNASFQSFVTGLRVVKGDDGAKTWLDAFKKNDPKSFDNNNLILDAVESGELEAGLINHYYWYEKEQELGAGKMNSKLHFFGGGDPGGLVNAAGVGVLKSSDRAAEAQKFVDFLLSAPSQTYFRDETFEYPLTADVTAAGDLPPLKDLDGPKVDLSDLATLEKTLEMLGAAGLT